MTEQDERLESWLCSKQNRKPLEEMIRELETQVNTRYESLTPETQFLSLLDPPEISRSMADKIYQQVIEKTNAFLDAQIPPMRIKYGTAFPLKPFAIMYGIPLGGVAIGTALTFTFLQPASPIFFYVAIRAATKLPKWHREILQECRKEYDAEYIAWRKTAFFHRMTLPTLVHEHAHHASGWLFKERIADEGFAQGVEYHVTQACASVHNPLYAYWQDTQRLHLLKRAHAYLFFSKGWVGEDERPYALGTALFALLERKHGPQVYADVLKQRVPLDTLA